MNLHLIKDQDLLARLRQLVQNERELLTQILHHLREVERRKLFSDLGYQSLFEYAVKELKYSEGQAGRRIQAMRLIKEIPEIEEKIASGKLSLSNISQAQSYFREFKVTDKRSVLESLENKSAREGQKILIEREPQMALPKERERILTETHTELRLVVTAELKEKLEELRSLLGIKGANMSLAQLIEHMVEVSIQDLKIKRFGKRRALSTPTPTSESRPVRTDRYISKAVRHHIWNRDQGKCRNCGGRRNLNIDHIQPLAMGGLTEPGNLRLLCFHCNQRRVMKE